MMKTYGLRFKDYRKLFLRQKRRCAICGKKAQDVHFNDEQTRLELVVDHCHDTGRVRGLLCGICNTGLGFFKDDRERLLSAVRYLEQFDDPNYTPALELRQPKRLRRRHLLNVESPPEK